MDRGRSGRPWLSAGRQQHDREHEGVSDGGGNRAFGNVSRWSSTISTVRDTASIVARTGRARPSMAGAEHVRALHRTVARTLLDGIRIASFAPDTPPNENTIVRDNEVTDAQRDGIAAQVEGDGPVSGLLLDGNTAQRSGDDGIDVRTASTTLTDNLARYNADLGIAAVAGVTDGGGNRAFGNGNPVQCTNVFCG